MPQSFDPSELLRIEMQQASHPVVLVAHHRRWRSIQGAQSFQSGRSDDACNRCAAAAYMVCDLSAGQPRSAKFHYSSSRTRTGTAGAVWPRRAVIQSLESCLSEASQPLPSRTRTDANCVTRFIHRPAVREHSIDQQGSTLRRESSILMNVHLGLLRLSVCSHSQIHRSRPGGQLLSLNNVLRHHS
jgi:hypothetical protein